MSLGRRWNQRTVKEEEEVLMEIDDGDNDDGDIEGAGPVTDLLRPSPCCLDQASLSV